MGVKRERPSGLSLFLLPRYFQILEILIYYFRGSRLIYILNHYHHFFPNMLYIDRDPSGLRPFTLLYLC